VDELEYQLAFRRPNEAEQDELARDGKPAIVAEVVPPSEERRASVASSTGSDGSMPPGARSALNDQIIKEEDQAGKEESAEIAQAAGLPPSAGQNLDLEETPSDLNDRMSMGKSGERQRMRKEKLGEKLMQVFGLAEREEVLEEMRCWLLRSVSKCFFPRR
jgi:sterol 3beta-glucosyltransferase